jgi:hypothetical protein
VFTHDFTSTFAVIKQTRICDFAFELFEAFTFAFNEGVKIHNEVAAAASAADGAGVRRDERLYENLSFLLCPRGFSAAVAASEFFDTPGGIDELLFAREKWMTSSTNTDLNIATRRAGVIHRAARAHNIGIVILWMNACFHVQKGAQNLPVRSWLRKG